MAASLFRHWRCTTSLYSQISRRHAYIVLLPQVPDDTAETNPILQYSSNPRFNHITTDHCVNAIGKLVIDYECSLAKMTEKLKVADGNIKTAQTSFSDIFDPLDALSAPIDHAWTVVKLMYLIQHNEEMSKAYISLHSRLQKARELNADKKLLNEAQRRVINKYLLESRLKGIEFTASQQDHFTFLLSKLADEKKMFSEKVGESTRRFFHVIDDWDIVKDFPESVLKKMVRDSSKPKKGPWRVTLEPEVYKNFMIYCPVRELRWNVWFASVTRSSGLSDSLLNTSLNIEKIRQHRLDEARLLGFENYAQMSMETKMAGSVKNVMTMIATLLKHTKPALEQQLMELQEFAVSKGFDGKLSEWDIPYWRNRYKQEVLGLNEADLRQYFPLSKVLSGLFILCKSLFGITIKDAKSKVKLWDEKVTYYEVFNKTDGKQLGSFYMDLFQRPPNKLAIPAWIESLPGFKTNPVVFLLFNIALPAPGEQPLLSLNEVDLIFQKFGHCLQYLLSTVPNAEVSGLTNVEWDVVDVCPRVLSNILMTAATLKLVSGKVKEDIPLPDSLIENILQARNHLSALDLTRDLYFSSLDLHMYSSTGFWLDVTRRVWSEFMPFPLDDQDSHPSSMECLWCTDAPASTYTSTWAKMIAADVFSAFEEAASNQSSESLAEVGARFRDTYLSLGGGCHPSEVFRRFRGRDPSPDALLKNYHLKD
uniref:Peptidase M3A/M3B catalytic domain-containing protein n=1 Tax=Strigamia maritima TaxID=126957 RepID=T1JBM7_STRMM